MVIGGAASVVTLLALAWVKELVGGSAAVFGADPNSAGVKTTITVFATILMYCVDVAINTGMIVCTCWFGCG